MGRILAVVLVLAAVLAACLVVATAAGTVDLPLGRTAGILLHAVGLGPGGGWEPWQETVLLTVRLPRVLVAALAGAALAVAGAVLQAIFRNPMADPGIIGISHGAGLGAVVALYSGLAQGQSPLWLPALAFAGGLACAFLVYAVAAVRGRTPVTTLLLSGIAVGGIAASLTAFVLSVSLANFEIGREIIRWLMGGLEGSRWVHVHLAAPVILGGCLWLLLYARDLNVLLTGEETATSLGVDVAATRRNLLILAALVTAASVAVTGVVGFVGLMVPHILRLLVGPDHRVLLPASLLGGAAFLVLADLLSRSVLPAEEIRLGVVTAVVGGVFFLYLLVRGRRALEELR